MRVLRLLSELAGVQTVLVRFGDGDDAFVGQLVRATNPGGAARVGRLIATLDRLTASHCTALHDVIADLHGPSAVIEHVRGRRLADVLGARERWTAGEAVAVLQPLAQVVDDMHERGVAHGDVGARHILLTAHGPVLDGFHTAELFAAHAPEVVRAELSAVMRDREGVRSLALDVLSRVDGARGAAARDIAVRLGTLPAHELCTWLAQALAELAAPVEVRAVDPPRTAPSPRESQEAAAAPRTADTAQVDGARGGLPELIARLLGPAVAHTVAEVVTAVRTRLEAVSRTRRVLVIGASAAVASAAILMAVIPGSPEEPAGVTDEAGIVASSRVLAGPSAPIPQMTPDSELSDDPEIAVLELLERREECFRELSLLCLEGINQSGSAASADDQSALLALRDGRESTRNAVTPGTPRLVERLGDSVLIEVGPETAPASLLLMRSEAGWRIRDWVTNP